MNKKIKSAILSIILITSISIAFLETPNTYATTYGPNLPTAVGSASGSFTNSASATAVDTIDGTTWGAASGNANAAMKGTEGQDAITYGFTPTLSENLLQVDVDITSAVTPSGTTFVVTAQLIDDSGTPFGTILSTPTKSSTSQTTDTLSFTSAHGWAAAGFDITDTDGAAFGVQIRVTSYVDGGGSDSALIDAILITLETDGSPASDPNDGIGQNNMWIFALGKMEEINK